jgi:hypothetical protein
MFSSVLNNKHIKLGTEKLVLQKHCDVTKTCINISTRALRCGHKGF